MKKFLLGIATFITMAVLCVVSAGAETYGDYTYKVLDDGTVEITDYTGSATELEIPSEIEGKNVTRIGDYAFAYCSNIATVDIPDGVTDIGDSAFGMCQSLESLVIPDTVISIGNQSFFDCRSLESIILPDGVVDIGENAFCLCLSLTSIIIPDSVTSINKETFYDCPSLTSITLPDNLINIGDSAFYGCNSLISIIFSDSITSIGDYAFAYCSSLTSLTLSDSIIDIGDRAFGHCSSLTSLTLPASVANIGVDVFGDCTSLKSINVDSGNVNFSSLNGLLFNKEQTVLIAYPKGIKDAEYTIPNNVIRIGDYAFSGCSSLTSISIPDSVANIGAGAFSQCTSLTSINIPESVVNISGRTFSTCTSLASITLPDSITSIGDDAFYACKSLTSVVLPLSVESIGEYAFSDCTSLTSISIPDGVTKIENYTFENCTSLISLTLSDNVKSIGYHAFENCLSLVSIDIPGNVSKICDWAFRGCTSLTSILLADSITIIGQGSFYGCVNLEKVSWTNGANEIKYQTFKGCSNLTKIKIPKSVTKIDATAFKECSSNLTIYCDQDTTAEKFATTNNIEYKYKVDADCNVNANLDGCTYTTNGDTIWITGYIGSDSSLILPSSVNGNSIEVIANYAFSNSASLTVISVPDSVTTIKQCAFKNCKSLKAIIIPSSVTTISDDAFNGCPSDMIIYCQTGSVAEKFAIARKINYRSILDSWEIETNEYSNPNCPDCSFENERTQDEVYYSDLYFGYSDYLSKSLYLLNYNSETFNSVNKVCDDYIKSPKFFLTNLEYSLPLVFDLSDYLKHLSDASGLTTFTYDNALDAANEELASRLLSESVLANQFNTEKKWIDGINKVIKVYNSFEKNFDVIEKSDVEIVEAMFVAVNDTKVFTYLSSTQIEQIREIVLPDISKIKDTMSVGSDALKAAKSLVIALMIEDMRFGVINSVLKSQYKDTTLYKGMSRLDNQLRNGYKSYFADNYLFGNDGLIIKKISGEIVDKITDEIFDADKGLYEVIGVMVELATWVAFDVLFDVPDLTDVTKALVLRDYAEDFFDLLQEKISCFESQFTLDDIKEFEMIFQAYIATNNLAMETCSKLILSSNKEYFNEIYQKYKDADIYTLTINSALDTLKQTPIEKRTFCRYKSWVVPTSVEYEICNGSNDIEPNKFYYIYTNQLPETMTVKLNSCLYISDNIETSKINLYGSLESKNEVNTVKVNELIFGNDGAYGTIASVNINNCNVYSGNSISITPDASVSKMIKVTLSNSNMQVNGNVTINPYGILTITSNSSLYVTGNIVVQAGTGNAFRHCYARMIVSEGDVYCEGNMLLLRGTWGYGGTIPCAELVMNSDNSVIRVKGDFTATQGNGTILELNGGNIYVYGDYSLEYSPTSYSSVEGTKTQIYFCGNTIQNVNSPILSNMWVTNTNGISLDNDTYINGNINLNGETIYLNGNKFIYESGGLFDGTTEYGDLVVYDRLSKIKSVYDGENIVEATDNEYIISADDKFHVITIETKSGAKYTNTIKVNTHICDFDEWVLASESTCDVAGTKTRTCKICKNIDTMLLPTVDHTYTSTTTPPTYYNQGYTLHECINCAHNYKDNFVDKLILPAISDLALKSRNYNSITLSWAENEAASGYILQQYKNDAWVNIANIKDNATTSYQITNLAANTSYKFRAVAYVTDGESTAYSSYTSALTISTAPAMTTGFAITGRGSDFLTITWTKNAGASGYIIQEQIDGVWNNVASIKGNATTSYTVANLQPNSFHRYRMVAYKTDSNGTCYGKYTGSAPGYTAPAMVNGFKVSGIGANSLTISWDKVTSANGYVIDIYRDGKWSQLAKITSNATTSYKATGLTLDTTYKFRIKSYATNGTLTIYSTYSSAISGVPVLAKVENLRMTNRGADFISVRWDKNADADGYMIYLYDGTKWTCVKTLTSASSVSHKITGLASGKAYKVTVKAYKTVNGKKFISDTVTISANTM